MPLLAADSASANSFAIPALVSGLAALVSPVFALSRWIQEKSIKHRYLDEMRRSGELLEFIQRVPEIMSTINATEAFVLERARVELEQSVRRVDALLEAKAIKASPPVEMAWPRRLLLLYAPRTWGATLLHAAYNLATVFSLLALYSAGYSDETDSFQWSEYVKLFGNPLFLTGICYWLFVLFLLWYVASTKDRWDKTLPVRPERAQRHFLRDIPTSVRDLLARVLLAYSMFDLIFPLGVRGPVKRALMSNPMTASVLSSIPETKVWEKVVVWIAAVACPVLAYLWADAEFVTRGKSQWLPFPHNLRFLYSPKDWKEAFAQLCFLLFLVNVAAQLAGLHKGILMATQLMPVPKDDADSFLAGIVIGPAVDIAVLGLLPVYASYRLGLKRYFLRKPATTPVSE
jgi:hypothetical protein